MRMKKVDSRHWICLIGQRVVAEFILDYWFQMNKVLLQTDNPVERRQILERAMHHAGTYVRQRQFPVFGGILVQTIKSHASENDSDHEMKLPINPRVTAFADDDLREMLNKHAQVIDAAYPHIVDAIGAILNRIRTEDGINITARHLELNHLNEVFIEFTTDEDHPFTFWRSMSVWEDRDPEHDLYLTPPYHPCRHSGTEVLLINGDTNYCIRQRELALGHISPPPESAEPSSHGYLPCEFRQIKHPYYARGNSFRVQVDPDLIRSKEAVDNLLSIVRALLSLNNTYVGVSGGFNSPYDMPHNVLMCTEEGQKFLPRMKRHGSYMCRGSEDDCVWQYETLEREGQLKGTIIPPWFKRESWLDLYHAVAK